MERFDDDWFARNKIDARNIRCGPWELSQEDPRGVVDMIERVIGKEPGSSASIDELDRSSENTEIEVKGKETFHFTKVVKRRKVEIQGDKMTTTSTEERYTNDPAEDEVSTMDIEVMNVRSRWWYVRPFVNGCATGLALVLLIVFIVDCVHLTSVEFDAIDNSPFSF